VPEDLESPLGRRFNILLDKLLIVEPEERFGLQPGFHCHHFVVLQSDLVEETAG